MEQDKSTTVQFIPTIPTFTHVSSDFSLCMPQVT